MRRPRIAAMLGLSQPRSGLEAVLRGKLDFWDAVDVDERSGLHCLLSDQSAAHPQQLIESEQFRRMLEQAKQEYQLVVLDSPPIMRVADGVLLSASSDVILFAVGWERTSSDMLAEALRRLPEEARSRTATVLTRVRPGRLDPLSYYAGYARGGFRATQRRSLPSS
jgi:Mrp family chromosome partitioning ATPase